MAKQDIKIYKVRSKEDYIKQREKDTGSKNIFLTEIKPEMSREKTAEVNWRKIRVYPQSEDNEVEIKMERVFVEYNDAKKAMTLAAANLPIKCIFVERNI